MNTFACFRRPAQVMATALVLCGPGLRIAGAQADSREPVETSKTNWTFKALTNVVEVWIPTNEFVTEFHTNWMKRPVTNLVEIFKTRWVTVTLTNIETVEKAVTNWKSLTLTNWVTVVGFKTNFIAQAITNLIEVDASSNHFVKRYKTNWVTMLQTNTEPVELVRTNWTTAYQTNWRTLTLTNWEAAVQFKTNWVKQVVTTTVGIDTPTKPVIASAAVEPDHAAPPTAARSESAPVVTLPAVLPATAPAELASTDDVLAIEAGRAIQSSSRSPADVLLRVGLEGDATAPLQVQEWRVERADGSVAFFVKERDFKRALPVGKYRVEVKARRDANSPLLTARRTLDVMPQDVVLQAVAARR